MTFWKKPDFKALQEAWYQRLTESGFQDAEELVAGELVLKQTSANGRSRDELTRTDKEDYYTAISQKVQETVFTSDVDRIILVRYSEGRKIKHICEELATLGQRRCRETIRFKVRIYEMAWGLRQYTPRQLHRKVS